MCTMLNRGESGSQRSGLPQITANGILLEQTSNDDDRSLCINPTRSSYPRLADTRNGVSIQESNSDTKRATETEMVASFGIQIRPLDDIPQNNTNSKMERSQVIHVSASRENRPTQDNGENNLRSDLEQDQSDLEEDAELVADNRNYDTTSTVSSLDCRSEMSMVTGSGCGPNQENHKEVILGRESQTINNCVMYLDVVVVYAKQDFDLMFQFIQWQKCLLNEKGISDSRYLPYDSEDFPADEVDRVEDIVQRASYIFMLLTPNFCQSSQVNFIKSEAIAQTRLDCRYFTREILKKKKYAVRPVHTEKESERSYKTPSGLCSIKSIDYHDSTSAHTCVTTTELLIRARQQRRKQESKQNKYIDARCNQSSHSTSGRATNEIPNRNQNSKEINTDTEESRNSNIMQRNYQSVCCQTSQNLNYSLDESGIASQFCHEADSSHFRQQQVNDSEKQHSNDDRKADILISSTRGSQNADINQFTVHMDNTDSRKTKIQNMPPTSLMSDVISIEPERGDCIEERVPQADLTKDETLTPESSTASSSHQHDADNTADYAESLDDRQTCENDNKESVVPFVSTPSRTENKLKMNSSSSRHLSTELLTKLKENDTARATGNILKHNNNDFKLVKGSQIITPNGNDVEEDQILSSMYERENYKSHESFPSSTAKAACGNSLRTHRHNESMPRSTHRAEGEEYHNGADDVIEKGIHDSLLSSTANRQGVREIHIVHHHYKDSSRDKDQEQGIRSANVNIVGCGVVQLGPSSVVTQSGTAGQLNNGNNRIDLENKEKDTSNTRHDTKKHDNSFHDADNDEFKGEANSPNIGGDSWNNLSHQQELYTDKSINEWKLNSSKVTCEVTSDEENDADDILTKPTHFCVDQHTQDSSVCSFNKNLTDPDDLYRLEGSSSSELLMKNTTYLLSDESLFTTNDSKQFSETAEKCNKSFSSTENQEELFESMEQSNNTQDVQYSNMDEDTDLEESMDLSNSELYDSSANDATSEKANNTENVPYDIENTKSLFHNATYQITIGRGLFYRKASPCISQFNMLKQKALYSQVNQVNQVAYDLEEPD